MLSKIHLWKINRELLHSVDSLGINLSHLLPLSLCVFVPLDWARTQGTIHDHRIYICSILDKKTSIIDDDDGVHRVSPYFFVE